MFITTAATTLATMGLFAFVILATIAMPTLVAGKANGHAEAADWPAAAAASPTTTTTTTITRAAPTARTKDIETTTDMPATTTTLASSNAPATITSEAVASLGAQSVAKEEKGLGALEVHTTAAVLATTLATEKQQQQQQQQQPHNKQAIKNSKKFMNFAKTTPAATTEPARVPKKQEIKEQIQIKNAKDLAIPLTTTATTAAAIVMTPSQPQQLQNGDEHAAENRAEKTNQKAQQQQHASNMEKNRNHFASNKNNPKPTPAAVAETKEQFKNGNKHKDKSKTVNVPAFVATIATPTMSTAAKTTTTTTTTALTDDSLVATTQRIKLAEIGAAEFNEESIKTTTTRKATTKPLTTTAADPTAAITATTSSAEAAYLYPEPAEIAAQKRQHQQQQQTKDKDQQHDIDYSQQQQQQEQEQKQEQQKTMAMATATATTIAMAEQQRGINIADLYPMKMEDFNPIIRDSNAKLLEERTIYQSDHNSNIHLNENVANEIADNIPMQQQPQVDALLLPNEVADAEKPVQQQQHKLHLNAPKLRPPHGADVAAISDFTGKLLAEQDGVITEIEQKFRLSEFATGTPTTTTTPTPSDSAGEENNLPTSTPVPAETASTGGHSVNHKVATFGGITGIVSVAGGVYDFIDRRVKKSFDFPLHHRAASDAMSVPHFDFANTKFNSDIASRVKPAAAAFTTDGNLAAAALDASRLGAARVTHPEFSTTKFYNSKELYNEMLQHSRKQQQLQKQQQRLQNLQAATTMATTAAAAADKSSKAAEVVENFRSQQTQKVADTATTEAAARHITLQPGSTSIADTTTAKDVTISSTSPTIAATATATTEQNGAGTASNKAKKYQKELKRAKLLLKAVLPANKYSNNNSNENENKSSGNFLTSSSTPLAAQAATSNAPTPTNFDTSTSSANRQQQQQAAAATIGMYGSATTAASSTTAASAPTKHAVTSTTWHSGISSLDGGNTNPSKATSKPIARPRILTRLQEKIDSLECEIQNVPLDSHLWRGNETHELLLPIMAPGASCTSGEDDCQQEQQQPSSGPSYMSWEGEAEIQSGDILIVEINDALLDKHFKNITNSSHNTQVYQVTRSGHEHCDVTEGILLDITPLVVDGRKLVTLYDKDLTEGVNLLIVVSELWGSQCVRLKVTTKTDNCGENADCSGKGVCYSNAAMEEYECQCCSGFAGPHCEEIDACTPSPCTNNGICVDLSQGHEGNSYQCLCPYGYTGKNCQYESDPCNSAECMNGGSCVGNSTHFRCDCTPGFTGPLCQHSLNECESSPCVHGICVDQEDGFRCFCQPGFAGELCNFEYNECESNPCQNGGECIDHIGSYECRCTKGYTGNRCQIKVDFCANKPCPEGHRCIDHGNDYSCECPGGRNGLDCNQMPRTQCNVNPCTHGGTCWTSGDSFYCACRPGYTGTMCEDEFVVETVVSSSEFMVDDTSARNFNDKTFGSSVVLKSPIELHNAYFAAGVLAAAIFIVAVVVTICHCKVNQTYRKFSTRTTTFFPILGFGRRPKTQGKLNKHWLSGKGLGSSGNPLRSSSSSASLSRGHHHHQHLPTSNGSSQRDANAGSQQGGGGPLYERPFQRHLAMNLENDMYYTVDFSENSQHSPLIQ